MLALKEAADIEGSFCGLRVRMGIHFGPVDVTESEETKRAQYSGESLHLTKALEDMAHGGQILLTTETWNLASTLGDRAIGRYQVLHMGTHVLKKGKSLTEGVLSKGVVQLVPEELSFHYFKARKARVPGDELNEDLIAEVRGSLLGRQFPPLRSLRQIGPSFHQSPYSGNVATIMFLYTSEVENEYGPETDLYHEVKESLIRLIRELLIGYGCGYHCKDFMLAFPSSSEAIRFSFFYFQQLRERESRDPTGNTKKISGLVKFGCVHGRFLCMGPDHKTGRADYFGKVVNRASRVAAAAASGTTYLGIPMSEEDRSSLQAISPDLGPDIRSTFIGARRVKGISNEISLFSCTDGSYI